MSGTVRITTTDTILHGLVAPALKDLHATHPLLAYELHAGNELASLTRRDADIAVRATKRPPAKFMRTHIWSSSTMRDHVPPSRCHLHLPAYRRELGLCASNRRASGPERPEGRVSHQPDQA